MPLFIAIVFISPFIAIIRDEIIIRWAIIEISLLGVLPLIKSKEAAFTYYVVQIIGSIFVLLAIIIISKYYAYLLLFMGLTLKLGAAPFHFWVYRVYRSCGVLSIFLISSIRKIPIYLIFVDFQYTASIYIGALTAFVGAVGGLGQKDLNPLLGYSSIATSGWFLASSGLPQGGHLIIWGHTLYILNLLLVLLHSTSDWSDIGFSLKILSLAGLPPFPGFFPKSRILHDISIEYRSTISLSLVVRSVIALSFYFSLISAYAWDLKLRMARCYSILAFTVLTWYFLGWVVGHII